jgi:UDPglucose 6-dehydrogenase
VKQRFGDQLEFSGSEYDALHAADALIICTEWGIFRNPDFERMAKVMNDKVIFDGRNLFDVDEMTEKGFYYNSIGRRTIES